MKTITLDEIMDDEDENLSTAKFDQDDDESYHANFVNEIRKKEQLEQIAKDSNQVNFDEDDDKFIIGL